MKEGYVKGLKEARRIIERMLSESDGDELPTDEVVVIADCDEDAIYYAECDRGHEIVSYERIEYGEDDGGKLVYARIIKPVWGKPLH